MDFSRFDIFPKLDKEYKIGTSSGGILSILSIITISLLSISEINIYRNPQPRQKLYVDMTKPVGPDGITISKESTPFMDVELNITFPNVPAYIVHFDILDSYTQLNTPLYNIHKKIFRIKKDGNEEVFNFNDFYERNETNCGNCYISDEDKKCCNSCKSVVDQINNLENSGITFLQIEQCKLLTKEFDKMEGEGTRMETKFRVPKTKSEFHICPGIPSINKYGYHKHNVEVFGKYYKTLNFSHHITTLKFSKNGTDVLNNYTFIQEDDEQFGILYQLDILSGSYSASKFTKSNPTYFPVGVTFVYDISPINAIKYIQREPIMHLISRLVIVIGGVLAIFKLLDSILFAAQKKNKGELNK